MPEDLCACDQSAPPDLDAWRAEAGACAPLDAAASPAPWFFDSYSSVHSEPLTREHSRIEATIPDDAADDDPAWATLPETLVCRVPCVAGDTGTAQGRADGAWVAAARTGWPRDAARVRVLCERVRALEAALLGVAEFIQPPLGSPLSADELTAVRNKVDELRAVLTPWKAGNR